MSNREVRERITDGVRPNNLNYDRSEIILPTIDKKSVSEGKQLAKLVIEKLSAGKTVTVKLGLKGTNAKEKLDFIIKTFVEVAQANGIDINNNNLAVALYYCVNPEGNLPRVGGAAAGLADVTKDSLVVVPAEPKVTISLFAVKQSLTRFIFSHIHKPKLINAQDFECNFGKTTQFFEEIGFAWAYTKLSPRSLVEIAYPEALNYGATYNPVIRPWTLLEPGAPKNEVISEAVAWIILHDLKLVRDSRLDDRALKKVAWSEMFDRNKLRGLVDRNGTNEDAVKLGVAHLIKLKFLPQYSRISPGDVEKEKARDWKSVNPDGSILIDEVTVRVMDKAKAGYSQIFSNEELIPTHFPRVPWATMYAKEHGTCLRDSGLKPAQALARIYGNKVFGWDKGQILPEYFNTNLDENKRSKLKLKLAHGLHQSSLGQYKDGIYTISTEQFEIWKNAGGLNCTAEEFIAKCKIATECHDMGSNISRAIFWLLTSKEELPAQIVTIGKKANLNEVIRLGIQQNSGKFSFIAEDSLRDIRPYEPEGRVVVELLARAKPKITTLAGLYIALKTRCFKNWENTNNS